MDQDQLLMGIGFWLILVLCISFHEWAHAFTADKLKDPTPRMQGRVTLNPMAHIDLIGTVLIPLYMILFPSPIGFIGWGKPVQINPSYFKHKTRDDILVTMAGPFSNLVLAFVVSLIGGIVLSLMPLDGDGRPTIAALKLGGLIKQTVMLNCLLVVFNLIPIPPLDGSRVMRHVVGMSEQAYLNLARWGFVILLVLINIPAFQHYFQMAKWALAIPFLWLVELIAN